MNQEKLLPIKSWSELGWEPVITSDGSWSLREAGVEFGELMHHSGGALAESRYIYGRLLPELFSLELTTPVHILSLGLGLGYNELLVAEASLQAKRLFYLTSYEKDSYLVEYFLKALKGEWECLPSDVALIYQDILGKFSSQVPLVLLSAFEEQRWQPQGPLDSETLWPSRPVNGYFWDAFSRKTSPALWDEEFLKNFIGQTAHAQVVGLSTYACNGPLKRALKHCGFSVSEEPGFLGKRKSTAAWRRS